MERTFAMLTRGHFTAMIRGHLIPVLTHKRRRGSKVHMAVDTLAAAAEQHGIRLAVVKRAW